MIVTGIKSYAFSESNIKEVVLPNSLKYIEPYAFNQCTQLNKINFPKNLDFLGGLAFNNCDTLGNIVIDCPNLQITAAPFENACAENLTINTKEIPSRFMYSFENFKTFNIGSDTQKVGFWFLNSNIEIPQNVKIVNGEEGHIPFESIIIPSNIEIFGAYGKVDPSGEFSSSDIPLLENECIVNPDCIIYGYQGTEAEIYANEWNLTFIALDSSEIMTGDANQDSEVTISDVVAISAFISNAEKYPISLETQNSCDVHMNGNGLNSSDAFMIQQYVTGIIDALN